jgi:hypothetical protein
MPDNFIRIRENRLDLENLPARKRDRTFIVGLTAAAAG